MYIPLGICESLAKAWHDEKDEERRKKLTIDNWFLRFYVNREYGELL